MSSLLPILVLFTSLIAGYIIASMAKEEAAHLYSYLKLPISFLTILAIFLLSLALNMEYQLLFIMGFSAIYLLGITVGIFYYCTHHAKNSFKNIKSH